MDSYRFDTHVHTSETSLCGRVDAVTLTRLYKQSGYQGIVITDHYYGEYFETMSTDSWKEKTDVFLEGYRNALAEGNKIGLNVLLGMEIRFNENSNDYLVYGMDENFLYDNPKLYEHTLQSFKEFIRGRALLLYQAHPFRICVEPADPAFLDGVEVYNGNPRHDSQNHRALEYAKKNRLKMLSSSDFHQMDDLARGGIILPEVPRTSAELAALLNENKVMKLLST